MQSAKTYKRLVKNCIKGNTKAQKELYDLFSAKMLSACFRYARNKTDAEDIFQSGWLKVFEKIYQLKNINLIEWWMRKIFINEALQFYDKTKRIDFTNEGFRLEQDNRSDIKIIQQFHYDQITELIQGLPEKMRLVFNLYVIEGYSHKEIAEMLGISEGASKSNLHDARKTLKRKIELLNTQQTIIIGSL